MLAVGAARRILAELRAGRIDPTEAPGRGDPFPLGARLADRSDADLDGLFGAGFAAEVAALPPESWSGPIVSSYGLHLVWMHARVPERMPALESVRGRLIEYVYRARAEERVHAWLAERRARYDVRIEEARELGAPPAGQALALPRPPAVVGD